ncbi:hypothetical protein BDV30DRAFT_205044 [Aspergillus minisclerotigenes]|uniref:Uncharacterized protein n=1 Tax=Aspergillus minisclerotigenes TaxID=656917 RepID=A0A5N6JHW2_9EURO|nr:hypothetical protein BDV30DRAFT_205044 [Aspergillus minisclerotigenes]
MMNRTPSGNPHHLIFACIFDGLNVHGSSSFIYSHDYPLRNSRKGEIQVASEHHKGCSSIVSTTNHSLLYGIY